jgi:hypothetical protein
VQSVGLYETQHFLFNPFFSVGSGVLGAIVCSVVVEGAPRGRARAVVLDGGAVAASL